MTLLLQRSTTALSGISALCIAGRLIQLSTNRKLATLPAHTDHHLIKSLLDTSQPIKQLLSDVLRQLRLRLQSASILEQAAILQMHAVSLKLVNSLIESKVSTLSS